MARGWCWSVAIDASTLRSLIAFSALWVSGVALVCLGERPRVPISSTVPPEGPRPRMSPSAKAVRVATAEWWCVLPRQQTELYEMSSPLPLPRVATELTPLPLRSWPHPHAR